MVRLVHQFSVFFLPNSSFDDFALFLYFFFFSRFVNVCLSLSSVWNEGCFWSLFSLFVFFKKFSLYANGKKFKKENLLMQPTNNGQKIARKIADWMFFRSLAAVAPLWKRLMIWHRWCVYMLFHVLCPMLYMLLFIHNKSRAHSHRCCLARYYTRYTHTTQKKPTHTDVRVISFIRRHHRRCDCRRRRRRYCCCCCCCCFQFGMCFSQGAMIFSSSEIIAHQPVLLSICHRACSQNTCTDIKFTQHTSWSSVRNMWHSILKHAHRLP